MSVITGGVVSIEDGKKADTEYTPARKVRVELRFDVPEGSVADTIIENVSALADAHVKRQLGQLPNPTMLSAAGSTTTSSDSISTAAPEGKPTRQAGPRKAKPVEVVLKPETPAADPAAVEDDFSAPEAPAAQEVKPITDAELHSAAQKKNGEIKNPLAIRTLVGSFRPEGSAVAFQLAQVPQERRREFLDKLAKLT